MSEPGKHGWPTPAETGGGSAPPALPPVAGDIRELLAATEDGVDVPAEGGFPAVRLIAPTLEALRPVYALLNMDAADLPPPQTNGTGPTKAGKREPTVNPERYGSLMDRTISLRVAVLAAVMPGLGEGSHAVQLARRLGTDALIIREAFQLCMLPLSLLGIEEDGGGEAEDGAEAREAPFPARPTK